MSWFPDVRDSSKRNVTRCTNFIQVIGFVSIINFDGVTLRFMGSSTQVYVFKENQGLKFQFILGKARKSPGSSVLYREAR